MTEGETLYRNILLEPDNDYHRLVYADWLEDQGEHGHAEYIRAAVELASEDAPHCPYGIDRGGDCGWVRNEPGLVLPCRLHELTRRLAELLGPNQMEWFGSALAQNIWNAGEEWSKIVRWERGFPAAITCNAEQFMQHRTELFSTHPITSVRLADKRPLETREGFWLWRDSKFVEPPRSPHALPFLLFDAVVTLQGRQEMNFDVAVFNSHEEAQIALSDACVQLGRESARRLIGLPEMTRATF